MYDYTLLCHVMKIWLCFTIMCHIESLAGWCGDTKDFCCNRLNADCEGCISRCIKTFVLQCLSCLADCTGCVRVDAALTHRGASRQILLYLPDSPSSVNAREEMPCQNVSVTNHSAILTCTPSSPHAVRNAHRSQYPRLQSSLSVPAIDATPHTYSAHNGSLIPAFSQVTVMSSTCIPSHV